MTGPQHYREAERLLAQAVDRQDGTPSYEAGTENHWHEATIAAAQVHATLALAAATAFPSEVITGKWDGYGNDDDPGTAGAS